SITAATANTLNGISISSGSITSGSYQGAVIGDQYISDALTISSGGSVDSAALTGTIASARLSGSYTGVTGVGALNAGSITSGFGSIDTGSDSITTTGNVSGGTGTVTKVSVNSESFSDFTGNGLTLSSGA